VDQGFPLEQDQGQSRQGGAVIYLLSTNILRFSSSVMGAVRNVGGPDDLERRRRSTNAQADDHTTTCVVVYIIIPRYRGILSHADNLRLAHLL